MKTLARVLPGILGLLLLFIGGSFMLNPGADLTKLRLGLSPVFENSEVGFATIRAWLGGVFLMSGVLLAAGALKRHAKPFLVVAIFFALAIIGRILGLVIDGSSIGAIRALVVEVVFLAIVAFGFLKMEEAETVSS